MRTEAEIRTQRNGFEKVLAKNPDAEDIQAIVDALNWVLNDSDALEEYKEI